VGKIVHGEKTVEAFCVEGKLWRKYVRTQYCANIVGGEKVVWVLVNREKIVEMSCRDRTFSEMIIVTCVSIGDVVMRNIVRVILSRTMKWRCMWQF
jgi:hypothetical protein